MLPAGVESKVEQTLNITWPAPRARSHASAARERATASAAGPERVLRATTTASASGRGRSSAGTPMVWTVRRPALASVLARSEAPV